MAYNGKNKGRLYNRPIILIINFNLLTVPRRYNIADIVLRQRFDIAVGSDKTIRSKVANAVMMQHNKTSF